MNTIRKHWNENLTQCNYQKMFLFYDLFICCKTSVIFNSHFIMLRNMIDCEWVGLEAPYVQIHSENIEL